MSLELFLEWDPNVPVEEVCEANIFVTAYAKGLKRNYSGTLSSLWAAESYIMHLVWEVQGIPPKLEEEKVELPFLDGLTWFRLKDESYLIAKPGLKSLKISTEKERDYSKAHTYRGILSEKLDRLEKKWYIEPRDEWVSDLDYWEGFFGTSNNLWLGSRYQKGSPSEIARQLAYDLKEGLRTTDWGIWFSPGYIWTPKYLQGYPRGEVIEELNKVLNENEYDLTKKDDIINELRRLADKYDAL